MKKLGSIFVILLLCINLIGCNLQDPKYINFSTKPNNHYYVDELKNKIINNEKCTVYVFDTNLYKDIEVPDAETSSVKDFITSIASENYSDESANSKEHFRIKIIFEDTDQYLIKIFNDSIISISPWDGNYKEDFVSMKNLPLRYNLLDFCNHISNKPLSK